MRVNGQKQILPQPMLLSEYLQQRQYAVNRIVVELNGAIISKTDYADVVLKDTDVLEIVSFVGGG